MKKMFLLTILFLITILPLTACVPNKLPQLIYHGEIITIRPLEARLWSNKAIIITPDGEIMISSPSIGVIEDGEIIEISEWDKWTGQIIRFTREIDGVYWVYYREGKDINFLISPTPIEGWNNKIEGSK